MVATQLVSELLLHFGHKAICSKDEAPLHDTYTVQTEINELRKQGLEVIGGKSGDKVAMNPL